MLLNRRTLLALLAGVVLVAPPHLLFARNGNGPGGHDNGNNGAGNGNGNDNGGGNGNGNGVGNDNGGGNDNGVGNDDGPGNDDGGSDNGIGNDDGSDDAGGDEDGDNGSDDDGGSSKKRDDIEWSQDRVLKERQLGRVIPLKTALRIVNTRIHGRVIDVDLMVRSGKPQYRVKVRRTDGVIRTVRLDARTGKVIALLGF